MWPNGSKQLDLKNTPASLKVSNHYVYSLDLGQFTISDETRV